MNDLFQKIKKPLIIIGVLFVCFIAYNILKPKTTTGVLSSATGATASAGGTSSQGAGQSILPLLLKIKDVNFDATFFNDPAFRSLEDFGQAITPEDEGRDNPFSPSNAAAISSSVEDLGYVDQAITTDTSTSTTKTTTTAK